MKNIQTIFPKAPKLIYWELTRACDLACKHCRAEAIPEPDPNELNTSEAFQLVDQIKEFDEPFLHLVITGGDPLKRRDLFEIIKYAVKRGLAVSIAPSGTNNLTLEIVARFKAEGVQSIGLSLDGSSAEKHDSFRGVEGCFEWTIRSAYYANKEKLPVQINTLVRADAIEDLPQIYQLVQNLRIMRWSLFFVVNVGRAKQFQTLDPYRCEEIYHWLYEISKKAPFEIKTTESPQFRRVAFLKMKEEGINEESIYYTSVGRGFGVRDGNGVMFISHVGDVYPSGFLPLSAGNVREESPVKIYTSSELFLSIRDTSKYKGKCGRCEFRNICGGSRARAYAVTGDYLESDPFCCYQPYEAHKV